MPAVMTPPMPAVMTPMPAMLASEAPRTSGALAVAREPEPAPTRNPPVTEDFEVRPAPKPAQARPAEEGEPLALWRALIDRVRKVNPAVAAMLDLAVPVTVTAQRIVVGLEDESFEDARAEQVDARTLLTTEAHAHFGTSTEVSFERTARGTKVASVAYLDAAKRKQMQVEARAAVENHPLVRHAKVVFEAELKDVKLPVQEE